MRITVSHTIHPVVQTPTGFTVTVERRIRASSDEEPAATRPAYTRPARRSQRGLGLRPPGVRGTHTRDARVAAMDDGRDQWRERAGWAESELEAAIVDRDTWRERAKRAESDLGVATAERDRLRERAEELEAKPNARDGFVGELTSVLNRHSRENGSGTPDFILAEFLSGCLTEFNGAVNRREAWYGRERARFGTRFEVDREGQA